MITIRKGTFRDEPDYLRVQFETFPSEKTDEERHRHYFALKVKNGEIFVLDDNGVYGGHFTFAKKMAPPFSHSGYLEEAAILEKYRRQGFGTKLLAAVIWTKQSISISGKRS